MILGNLLSPSATLLCDQISSKKRLLEKVSQVMAETIDCPDKKIFDNLICREKLGTTALGGGIAIPHGRNSQCEQPTAVFILLKDPIDYDAPDGKPVDIIFAILVPEDADRDHLGCLAKIAEILSNEKLVSKLRSTHCNEVLYELIEEATQ